MAKTEERDWAEIIAEVRGKAQSEIDEFVEEIKPRLKDLVKKVRQANFHDEAEELLSKLRKMANDFSHSEDGPKKTKPSTRRDSTRAPLYRDETGKEWYRAPKSWTEAQKKNYKLRKTGK